jgi:hypothetical protein
MKLGENNYGHSISAKFDNQSNHFSHFRVMALYWYKKKANSLTGIFCGTLALLFLDLFVKN